MMIDSITRGNMLELASLLTTIQHHLLPEGFSRVLQDYPTSQQEDNDPQQGPLLVQADDLKAAHEYQCLLDQEQELLNQRSSLENYHYSKEHLKEVLQRRIDKITTDLNEVQKSLKDTPLQARKVHCLCTRLQVWWTKESAQHFLLKSESNPTADSSKCCYSPLLGLPGSSYFSSRFPSATGGSPPVQSSQSAFHEMPSRCGCCLPFPPNKYTWEEFARILHMVALLDKDTTNNNNKMKKQKRSSLLPDAFQSPFTCCFRGNSNPKAVQQMYNKTYEFTPEDVLALWVRAQRSTEALRHLHMIFTVVKLLPTTQQGGEVNDPPKFQATLGGNPSLAKDRVCVMSRQVDALIEWSVTNQVVHSYDTIVKYLGARHGFGVKKRRLLSTPAEAKPTKRVRRDTEFPNVNMFPLKVASYTFVLRWFARKHRDILSVLFSKHRNLAHLDIASSKHERKFAEVIAERVDFGVKEYMTNPEIADRRGYVGDLTFGRVDRRLGINEERYWEEITMPDQIEMLLVAMKASRTWDGHHVAKINAAMRDVRVMCDQFLGQSQGVYQTACNLVDIAIPPEELKEVLNSMPKPYPDPPKGGGEQCVCVNCEKVFKHQGRITDSQKIRFREVMKASDQLRKLCEMKYPTEVPRPDFELDVTWEPITISVHRNIFKDNKPQSLGLALRSTLDCADVLNKLSNDSATVADLVAIKKYEQRTDPPSLCYPMRIGQNGVLIVDVANSNVTCGKEAGFLVGDVIVGVQHMELVGDCPDRNTQPVNFATASMEECMETLKIPSRKMKFNILRPSKPIVEGSKKWYKSLKALNRVLFWAMSDEDFNLHCCPDCIERCQDSAYLGETKQEEAKKCRALIRRLGLESYAQSFVEDNVEFIQATRNLGLKVDGLFVSLRRLDRILSHIVEEKSVPDVYYMPSWACDGDEGRKLEWASGLESQPSALLCSAVSGLHHALQANSAASENTRNDFKRFLQHFLLSFSSWCIMSSPYEDRSIKTSGPSPLFVNMRQPWFQETCIHCHGRKCTTGSNTCDKESCNMPRNFKPALVRGEEFMSALNEYTECSSFVGKTLLVLPNDPLVEALKSVVEIRHEDRPVEFVVVSYLPAGFGAASLQEKPKEIPFDDFEEDSGFFHVLPVSNPKGMEFVLTKCKKRGEPTSVDADAIFSWASLEVLNLKGVSRVSLSALTRRIRDSDSIRCAIDSKVAILCSSDGKESTQHNCDGNEACSLTRWVRAQKQVVDGTIDGSDPPTFLDKLFKLDVDDNNLESDLVREDFLQGSSVQKSQNFKNVGLKPNLEILPCKFENPNCRLLYSDLHYSSTAERLSLEASLQNSIQAAPGTMHLPDEPSETLLLERKVPSLPGAYDGIGYGFELVLWPGEKYPRIGAVHQVSPASSVGLKTHDIVLSAGGMEMSDIPEQSKLVAGLLGAPTCFRVPSNLQDVIPLILSAAKSNLATLGPLVMVVQRSRALEHHLEGATGASLVVEDDSPVEHGCSGGEAPKPLHTLDSVRMDPSNADGAPLHSSSRVGTPEIAPELNSHAENSHIPDSKSQMVSSRQADDSTSSIHNSRDSEAASSTQKTPLSTNASSHVADTVTDSNLKRTPEAQSQAMGSEDASVSRPPDHVVRTAQSAVAASDAAAATALLIEAEGQGRQRSDSRSATATYSASDSTQMQVSGQVGMHMRLAQDGNSNAAQLSRHVASHPMRSSAGQYTGNAYRQRDGTEAIHQVRHQGNPPGTLNNLLRVVQNTAANRIQAGLSHLYRPVPGEPGLVLTLLETAVFLEALFTKKPKLGVRLLIPRYDMTTVHRQLEILMRWTAADVQRIPKISTAMYNFIVMLDYERSASLRHPETGPFVMEEGGYHYREPVDILPIDRSIELALNSTREFLGPQYQETPGPPTQNALDHYIRQTRSIPPDRIRGGGSASPVQDQNQAPESLYELSLKNIEKSRWRDLPVYAYVRLDDLPNREVLAVGYLNAPATTGVSENVMVRVHYISNIGFLEVPQTMVLYTDDVFAVDEHVKTEASEVVDMIRTLRSDEVDKRGPEGPVKFLGCLPDGRHIVWLPTDPGALFVSPKICLTKLEFIASVYRNLLATHEEEAWSRDRPNLRIASNGQPFLCPWGCSFVEDENRPDSPRCALSFGTREELGNHCKECHMFHMVPTNDVSINCHGMPFLRIVEGEDLHEFRCDLASAIVARHPRMYIFATKAGRTNGQKTGFDKSPSGDRFCLSDSRDSHRLLHKLNEKEQKTNWQVKSLLALWDQVEHIRQGVNPRLIVSGTDESSSSLFNVCRSCQKLPGTKTSGFMDCSLCSLPWETCIGWNSFGNATLHQLRRGVGCQTIGRISNMTEAVGSVFFEGRLGIAKILLLSIAESVPSTFRKRGTTGTMFSDTSAFEKWKLFLKTGRNTQMIQQSFVVFLASLDHSKLPRWWSKNNGGWWTSQPVLSGDLAGLFFRLYACEAAFAEASVAPSA